MKKRTWSIVLIVIVAVAACVGIYFTSRPTTPVEPTPPVVEPGTSTSVVLYVPDETVETLTPVGAEVADDSDQALVDALVEANALPAGCEIQSSKEAEGVLTLDMNVVYGNAVRSSGTAGETMLVYSLVNTFIQARGVDKVMITIDGGLLETGHAVYDTPLEMDYTS
ncbi:GerMN domain-containing protein [Butyricicoccus sp. Marseille-Q5471]|uniref:GerMN domain-containing protein n=1 Tax=Butyricicoccus sp. Marseille-Q5471 TaxID=3039493 RepID=UPI0024BC2CB1|nr:GerMN domain-containing protein [Butyricicoccus sp. Marseille-Q5471]